MTTMLPIPVLIVGALLLFVSIAFCLWMRLWPPPPCCSCQSGPSGAPGMPGPVGLPGASGAFGVHGQDSFASGPSGSPGQPGPSGASGLNVSGPSGASGASGGSGAAGALGFIDPSQPLFINAATANALSVPNASVTVGGTATVSTGSTVNLTQSLGLLGGYMKSADFLLTANQLLNFSVLNTPITLVPAQGPNTMIRVYVWTMAYIPGTAPFKTVTGDTIFLYFVGSPDVTNSTSLGWASASPSLAGKGVQWLNPHFWSLGSSIQGVFSSALPYPNGANGSQKNYINVPLLFGHCTTSLTTKPVVAVDWTNGDGTLYVSIQYIVWTGLP